MHKLRDGIVPYAASFKRFGGIAKSGSLYAGDANVDSLGFHVLAVLCDSAGRSTSAEERIAPGSAVAADDVNYAIWLPESRHD